MIRLYSYIALFIILILSGCEPDYVVPIQNQAPKGQVVKTILEPGELTVAYCNRATGITQPHFLETAVTIQVKNPKSTSINTFNFFQPGIYQWNCTLRPRDSFLFVYQGIIDTFSVADKIPSAIRIQSVDTSTAIVPGIGKTQVFTIRFRDSAIDKNWYQLQVKRQFIRYTFKPGSPLPADSQILTENMRIDGNELPFIRNAYNNYTDRSILFTDEIFNGVNTKFQFHNLKPWSTNPNEKTLSVEIRLENLSQSLYNYLNTEAAHLWQKQSVTQLPNPLFSNVPQGFGVIGAKTSDHKTIPYQ